jgi:hypothetical protein
MLSDAQILSINVTLASMYTFFGAKPSEITKLIMGLMDTVQTKLTSLQTIADGKQLLEVI